MHAVMASMCEINLRKTIRFGGRKNPPGDGEIEAILVVIQQLYYFHLINMLWSNSLDIM